MNKKIVTLILVILISFCFLGIVVADNATHDDNNTADHDKKVDNKTDDNTNTVDKSKTVDKPKKNYIKAEINGNDIKFSDGFRGFILDYSKSPASSGDEFKRVSTSKLGNSNVLKLAIIECYKQNSVDQIGKILADFVKTGSSNTKVGEAVAASHAQVGDQAVVKIDNHTEAVFYFEVLKSVSGNESDYFAYKVSFRTIDDDEEDINQISGLDNVTNVINATNVTNATSTNNETDDPFLKGLYDIFALFLNALYDAWKPVIDTFMNFILMIVNALEEFVKLFEEFNMGIHALVDGLEKLLMMLGLIWEQLDGILKLLSLILTAIEQLINLIAYAVDFIVKLIYMIISLLQQIIALLQWIINFILYLVDQLMALLQGIMDFFSDLFNQLSSLLKAILDLLSSAGSSLVNVIKNAAIIAVAFMVITVGAFVYDRFR
ncbi:hypothetical protein [Methanobrevibacter sp.]|uniref:phage tail protein n=1 Tax=Methanobrevibacter sp. TaxID=66852 RepID=UPI00388FD1AB